MKAVGAERRHPLARQEKPLLLRRGHTAVQGSKHMKEPRTQTGSPGGAGKAHGKRGARLARPARHDMKRPVCWVALPQLLCGEDRSSGRHMQRSV
jgi:hypothetical protein